MDAKTKNIVAWVVTAMMAFMIIKAGGLKLMNHSDQAGNFVKWGYPDWFMYLIGGLEVLGGIGLFIPKTRTLAIFGIIGIMLGAIYTHVIVDGNPTHVGGAVAVSVLGIVILMLRKGEKQV